MSSENRKGYNRREFFSYLTVGWVAFSAAAGGLLSFVLRYLYPNVIFEPVMDFVAGRADEYEPGIDERWKNSFGVWMLRDEGKLVAISTICTHLGCIPNWLPAELKFKCACHGSGYYKTGINFEGPAPRPLERFKIFYNTDGKVVVDKTKVFRYEKGEWSHPDSFITI